jgi:predicted transposase YbfD/YdcC
LAAAKRLLQQLHKQHRHFADVIVYDALACNAPWINAVKPYNIDSVVRVKNMSLTIVKDAKAAFKKSSENVTWSFQKTASKIVTISAWETSVSMKGVTEPLRFIKFLEKTTDCNTNKSKYNQMFIITTAHAMAIKTLYKIIHARWGIENNIFRQLKTEWHMNHCFIHHENGLEAALMFMIISFNLIQLFLFRRMSNFRSQKLLQIEVVERIVKEMVSYDARGEYLIDTG